MDAIASIGVGAVAGQTLFTGSFAPTTAEGTSEFTGAVATSALKLIQSATAISPGPEHALDVVV